MHQDPPECATGGLLLGVGAADGENGELVSGVVVGVVVVVVVARVCVAVDAVAFPCRPITAAMNAAAAVEAAATTAVTRFTRCLPSVRMLAFLLSVSIEHMTPGASSRALGIACE
jgi:hypothetical protein